MNRRLALLALSVAAVATSSLAPPLASAGSAARAGVVTARAAALSPTLFAELSTGIALVRTFSCGGQATGEGTGFLVGSRVVMTARHVVHGACRVEVLVDGHWMGASSWVSWYKRGRHDLASADVATIELESAVSGHLFRIRSWSAGVGTHIAALGHPLGASISLTQGKVVEKAELQGVPVLAVRLLGASGSSGSPLVDDHGNVVGIVQIGLTVSVDALGQLTTGAIVGIDLPSWWPTAGRNLCHAYKAGGIAGCGSGSTAPEPTPPPQVTPRPTTPPRTTTPVPRGTHGQLLAVRHRDGASPYVEDDFDLGLAAVGASGAPYRDDGGPGRSRPPMLTRWSSTARRHRAGPSPSTENGTVARYLASTL